MVNFNFTFPLQLQRGTHFYEMSVVHHPSSSPVPLKELFFLLPDNLLIAGDQEVFLYCSSPALKPVPKNKK